MCEVTSKIWKTLLIFSSKIQICVNGKKDEHRVSKDKQINQILARAYAQWLSFCLRKAKKVVVIPFPSDSWASLTHTAYAFAFHILFLSYLSLFFSCHCHFRVQLQVDAHPLFTKLPPPPPPTDLFQRCFQFQSCMYLVSIGFLFLYSCLFVQIYIRNYYPVFPVPFSCFFAYLWHAASLFSSMDALQLTPPLVRMFEYRPLISSSFGNLKPASIAVNNAIGLERSCGGWRFCCDAVPTSFLQPFKAATSICSAIHGTYVWNRVGFFLWRLLHRRMLEFPLPIHFFLNLSLKKLVLLLLNFWKLYL